MNSKQRKTLVSVSIVIISTLIIWLSYGREIFTKTQVLVEKKDELFPDMVQKQWMNKFIWGLDLSGAISLLSIVIGGFLYFHFREKKRIS